MYKVIRRSRSPAGTYRRAVMLQPGTSLSWPSATALQLGGSELFVLPRSSLGAAIGRLQLQAMAGGEEIISPCYYWH